MFSMARDNRLPPGKFLAKVNKRTGTPVITGRVSLLAIGVLLVNLGEPACSRPSPRCRWSSCTWPT